jgi:hypothetical protein
MSAWAAMRQPSAAARRSPYLKDRRETPNSSPRRAAFIRDLPAASSPPAAAGKRLLLLAAQGDAMSRLVDGLGVSWRVAGYEVSVEIDPHRQRLEGLYVEHADAIYMRTPGRARANRSRRGAIGSIAPRRGLGVEIARRRAGSSIAGAGTGRDCGHAPTAM